MEPTSAFSIQYSVDMLFMVLVGGMGTIEGPIVGGLAVVTTLVASRGLWGLASERLGWSLLPVGYRVRQPGARSPSR